MEGIKKKVSRVEVTTIEPQTGCGTVDESFEGLWKRDNEDIWMPM